MGKRRRAVTAVVVVSAGALIGGCSRDAVPPDATPTALSRASPPSSLPRPISGLDDAEAAQSSATPTDITLTELAPSPSAARAAASAPTAADGVSPGAPSDAQIAQELQQMEAIQKRQAKGGGTGHGVTLHSDGTAAPAPDVPAVVARVIAGANAIAEFPYVYGGGHASFVDTAYDCSGSVSYALAAGGLLTSPKTSGQLARTGARGPGRWITIYANEGHTFMYIDGLRYDTSGRSGPRGTRWQTAPRRLKGFVVRHPPGL